MAPALRDRYHLSLGQVGVLISASLVGSLFSLLLWGLATDHVGERTVLVASLLMCGGALIGAAAAHSYWLLFGLLLLAGMAGAGVQSASGRSVSQWFEPGQRGLALGIRQTAIPISGFAVALLLPPVVRSAGTGWGFAALGFVVLAGMAVGGTVLIRHPSQHARAHLPRGQNPIRDRGIWTLSIASALLLAPQLCVSGFTVLYLHDSRGLSDGDAAAVLAVTQLVAIAGRVLAGRWSDHVRSNLRPLRTIALGSTCLVAALAATLAAPLAVTAPALVIAGAISMSWNSLSFASALDLAGEHRSGSAIGLQQTILNLPGAAYPTLFAALVTGTSWRTSFALLALFPLLGWRMLRAVPEVRAVPG